MKRCSVVRAQLFYELAKNNPWYRWELEKKYLNPKSLEVEARSVTKHLKV